MNSVGSRRVLTLFFLLVSIIAMVAVAFFSVRLSAASQLFLDALVPLAFVLALATGCYETLEPGEVLIVSGRGGVPKVVRGGAFVFPVVSRVSRMRLTPIWIEFPRDSASNALGPMSREDRLITKDGLPVTTLARVQITIAGDDASIIKVVEAFGQKPEAEVKEHFTKLLGGTIAKVIAETSAADLRDKHQEFEDRVQGASKFEEFGYRSTSRVTIWPVTQLSIGNAGLEGGDKIRAERILDIFENQEKIRKIDQHGELSKATAKSESEQLQRDIDKQAGEARKKESEHAHNKKQEENTTELAALKVKGEEDIGKRRIEKDGAIKRAELQKDRDLSDLQVEKLSRDAKIRNEEYNLKVAAAEAAKREGVLRAQAEFDAGEIRLKLTEEQQRSAIRIRGEDLRQNIENQQGDLEYQLRKEVLKTAAEMNRDANATMAAAFGKANITLVGDPAAATQLAKEQVKALSLGVRGNEILSLLNDVRLHNAIGGVWRAIRSSPAASAPTVASEDRDAAAGRVNGAADNRFEP